MLKETYKITKDYFKLLNSKDKYLHAFIIICLINILISLLIPYYASLIISSVTTSAYNTAIKEVLLLCLVFVINKALSFITNILYAKYFKNTYVEVHKLLVNSVSEFDEEYTRKINSGKVLNSSNIDILNIAELPSIIFEMIIEFVKLIILYVIFFKNNIIIFFYSVFINTLYYITSKKCITKSRVCLKSQRKYADKMTSLLSQILRALKDIKSLGVAPKLNQKMNNYRKKWQESYYEKRKYLILRKTWIALMVNIGKIILYFILIYLLKNNYIKLATFILMISYYEKTREAIDTIISFNISLIDESVSFYRVNDIIEHNNGDYLDGEYKTSNIDGVVEFKKVSFKYDDKLVLKNVSFKIEKNTITTFVGEYGVGKSTIFNLLLRLYKIDEGKIFVDGIDIYEYSKDKYNSFISVVNQKTFVFNFSIKDNLSLIDSNKERQIEVCKKVGIHNYIMSLKNGYNTILKEDAANLSGGQKQLLSLARVLLLNPKIILFDEVTSSLDPKTTHKIYDVINELKKDHTILVITHNKEVMKMSDNLIVINKGRIITSGKHEDLIKNDDTYKRLIDIDI